MIIKLFICKVIIKLCLAIRIIQTEDNTLHFIIDNNVSSVEISSFKRVLPALIDDRQPSTDEIRSSNRVLVDSIEVSQDGYIFIDNLQFNIDSLLDAPKIYKNLIFQVQKRYETFLRFDVIVLLVYLDLKIIDSASLYTRIKTFSYIYYPFDVRKEITVNGNTISENGSIFTFDKKIIAVYDTVFYKGARYMNRIYTNSNLQIYTPKKINKKKFTWEIFSLIIFLCSIYFFSRPKHFKLIFLEYETSQYFLYRGEYNNTNVIIKKYKNKYNSMNEEVNGLTLLDSSSLSKILYYKSGFRKSIIIFEESSPVNEMSKNDLFQFVSAILYLHTNYIFYKNYNPVNIRRRKNKIILFNVFSIENNRGWIVDDIQDNESRELQAVGNILHYFMTGYHLYDTKDVILEDYKFYYVAKPNKQESITNKLESITNKQETRRNKSYTFDELCVIEENMKNHKYKIRIECSLEHDLIYHTINNRTTISRLVKHPYFWLQEKVFNFLANYSDLLEGNLSAARRLERNKNRIFETSWDNMIDDIVKEELEVFRHYNYNNAKDLIRVIRNKGRHYNQIPETVRNMYKSFPIGFIDYWVTTFPRLLIVCYNCGESLKSNELLTDFY